MNDKIAILGIGSLLMIPVGVFIIIPMNPILGLIIFLFSFMCFGFAIDSANKENIKFDEYLPIIILGIAFSIIYLYYDIKYLHNLNFITEINIRWFAFPLALIGLYFLFRNTNIKTIKSNN